MTSKFLNFFRLVVARLVRSCKINSLSVSTRSLKGKNIEVMRCSSVDGESSIGSYTYIGCNTNITKSTIGRYCSIANNVSIGQGEHSLDQISTSSIFYKDPWKILTSGICDVGSDVWIGVDAVILRGVTVEIGAVIGANAVVTKNVPPFAIVAGVPARIIGYRFLENERQLILDSHWWEMDPSDAKIAMNELKKRFISL